MDFLMRSLMFVPAYNQRLLNYAIKTDADILLLDIEDSAPHTESKQAARDNIINLLSTELSKDKLLFPRVNDCESGQLLKDVQQLTTKGISGFMYPKVKTAEDIFFFSKLLEILEYEKAFPINTFKIIALIETTSAVMNIQDICKVCPERLIAVAFGSEDFIVDMGGWNSEEGGDIFTARAMIAMGARANGVMPIDTVHIKVHDLEDLEENLKISKKLGFEGTLVLNPKELPLVHKYYSPSENDIRWAKDILTLSRQIDKEDMGVAFKAGQFIGPPIVKKAYKILQKQQLIETIKNNGHGTVGKYLLSDI